jgi:hypothetical protein
MSGKSGYEANGPAEPATQTNRAAEPATQTPGNADMPGVAAGTTEDRGRNWR